jgi:alpha-tubulin suppressor-like RCC1 family protein
VSAVRAVAAGTVHTCAVHEDGAVSCWGYGPFIGPRLPAVTPPVRIVLPARATAVAVGIQAACALLEGGTVQCWGDLGRDAEAAQEVVREDGTPLGDVSQIAGGSVAFCAGGAAAVHCWGENKASELARPASMTFPPRTAVQVLDSPRSLLATTVAVLVYDGAGQLCGWGNNDSAIVPGARGIVERPTCAPAPIPGLRQLTAGDGHACAHRGGAAFSCWGSNAGGQLGNGDDTMMDVPLPGSPQSLPTPIASLAAGAYHTCALLEDGRVMCWGSNEQGECGQPQSAPIFSPVMVEGIPGRAVGIGAGAGAQHTCVVMEDGAVFCWGSDVSGQLGAGATAEDPGRFSAQPVPVRW